MNELAGTARRRGRAALALLTASAMIATISACTAQEPAEEGGTLVVAQPIPPVLDPAFLNNDNFRTIVANVFDTLVHATPDGTIEPALAESWASDDDGAVWTFTIRDDAEFSDGSPVTAEDIRYSLVRAMTPVSADEQSALGVLTSTPKGLAILPDLEGAAEINAGEATTLPDDAITAPDASTLVISLVAPSSDLLARLANPALGTVSQDNVENADSGEPWWYAPVASGPFQVTEVEPDSLVTLEANPGYYGDQPKLDSVEFRVIDDTQTAIVAWESEELDVARVETSDVQNLRGAGHELVDAQLAGTTVVLANPIGPTSDMHVLRAIAMATDRDTLVKGIDDLVSPALTFTSSQLPGYPESEFDPLEFDVEAAKAELALSPYAPEEINLRLFRAGSLDARADQILAQMWEQNLGITVSILTELPPATAVEADAANLLLLTQGPNYVGTCAMAHRWPDFLVFAEGANNVNFGAIGAPGLERIVEDCSAAETDEEAWEEVVDFEQLLTEVPQFIPLWYGKSYYLVQPRVHGIEFGPSWDILNLADVTVDN